MKTIKLITMFGFIAMFVWNCSSSTSVDNWDSTYQPYAQAERVQVFADSLIDLAPRIPGFGGLFINNSGQLTIYLTQPAEQKANAKEVLSNSEFIKKALSNTSATVANMEIKKGQFTFLQLYNWKGEVSSKILPINGVYLTGIDQSQNVLFIGVKDKAARDNSVKELVQQDVPTEAVMFYKMSPPEFY